MCIAIPPPGASNSRHSTIWRILSGNPLRLLSFAAVTQLVLFLMFFVSTGECTVLADLPVEMVHAVSVIYGVGGLLLLAVVLFYFPQWLAGGAFHYARYTSVFTLMLLGFPIFYVALFFGRRGMAMGGWLLVMLGWLVALQGVWNLYRMAPATRKGLHEFLVLIALIAGGVGLLVFFAGMLSGQDNLLIGGRCLGLWGMLALGWLTVMHRLHPGTFRFA